MDIELNSDGFPENLSKIVFKLRLNSFLYQFISHRVPKENEIVKCRITRDKQGLDKHMYPMYYLHMEQENDQKVFIISL